MKSTIVQELVKAGLAFVIMSAVTYVFWQENKQYQERVNKRLEKVEQQALDCANENINILKDYVQKSNIQLDKNNKAIKTILNKIECQ